VAKIRILVVEDSLTVRKRLVEVLSSDPDCEIVGEAEDGKRALEMCQALRPHVMTLDMVLPVMSGLTVTEYVMAYCPTPIVIVSGSDNRGELYRTYDALAAGAVEVMEKPAGDASDQAWEQQLLFTVKIAARVKVITHPRARMATPRPGQVTAIAQTRPATPRLVAIGASTGGPGALMTILRALPANYQLPILLVIHIGESFGLSLAEWLDGVSPLRVRPAVDGELLPRRGQGEVLMATPNRHLVLRQGRLRLVHEPERHSCRPSVDVLFESLAQEAGSAVAACLLTGMGKDGATGLLAIRQAGGHTIAQDEATSIVYGMPREAIQRGAAAQVLPLQGMAGALIALAGGSDSRSVK
jgi:two-component system chemotaxis response regulator CheB